MCLCASKECMLHLLFRPLIKGLDFVCSRAKAWLLTLSSQAKQPTKIIKMYDNIQHFIKYKLNYLIY